MTSDFVSFVDRSAESAWKDAGFTGKAGAGMHITQSPAHNLPSLSAGQHLRPNPPA